MDGILIIDKPKGMTSRDVVNIVSKSLHTKKIGHTGTLDPLATGVLILAIGKATKIIELLTNDEKEYVAEVKVGLSTDTLDITGNILKQQNASPFVMNQIKEILPHFLGTYEQEVPLYSAVRVNGKRLYQYARAKEIVSLPKRKVTIKSIRLLDLKEDEFTFSTLVSKGTYIRSFIRDIGDQINCPCCMKNLRRTRQGIFSIADAYTIDDVTNQQYRIIPIEDAIKNYPKVIMKQENVKKIKNGVPLPKCFSGKIGVLYDEEDHLLAIYQESEEDSTMMRPWKVFS